MREGLKIVSRRSDMPSIPGGMALVDEYDFAGSPLWAGTRLELEQSNSADRPKTWGEGAATPLHLHKCVARFVSDS